MEFEDIDDASFIYEFNEVNWQETENLTKILNSWFYYLKKKYFPFDPEQEPAPRNFEEKVISYLIENTKAKGLELILTEDTREKHPSATYFHNLAYSLQKPNSLFSLGEIELWFLGDFSKVPNQATVKISPQTKDETEALSDMAQKKIEEDNYQFEHKIRANNFNSGNNSDFELMFTFWLENINRKY